MRVGKHLIPRPIAEAPRRRSEGPAAAQVAALTVTQALPVGVLGWSLLPLLVTAPLAARALLQDRDRADTWLVVDDGDGTAWRHCAEQAKHWVREGRAFIEDPYSLSLLEDADGPNIASSRATLTQHKASDANLLPEPRQRYY